MKRLVINGDDFGMNERCSLAIAQAFSEGLITDTTMMANGMYFDQAVALAEKAGFCDRIGIHLNLTEGSPLTENIGQLSVFVRDGSFHREFWQHPRPLTEKERDAVIIELSTQISRLREIGLNVTHADSHHYIHTYSCMAQLVAGVLKKFGIRRVRINRTFHTEAHPMITENRIDNSWWREQGFITLSHFGRLSDARVTQIPDDTEIMVHPDFDRYGVLIDRERTADGYPVGTHLFNVREIQ